MSKLKEVRDLLATPGVWVKYSLARNANGETVDPRMPEAVCFCLSGALQRVGASDLERHRVRRHIIDNGLSCCMGHFNDACGTVEPILALLDELCKA